MKREISGSYRELIKSIHRKGKQKPGPAASLYRCEVIPAFGLHLVRLLQAQQCLYEVLGSTAAVTRDASRRGLGWLAGQADIGWRNRIGWDEVFHLLLSVTPMDVNTGFGFDPGSHP